MIFPLNPIDNQSYKANSLTYKYSLADKAWKKQSTSLPDSILNTIDMDMVEKIEVYDKNTIFNTSPYFTIKKRDTSLQINQFNDNKINSKNTLTDFFDTSFNTSPYFTIKVGSVDFFADKYSVSTIAAPNTAEFSYSGTLKTTLQ